MLGGMQATNAMERCGAHGWLRLHLGKRETCTHCPYRIHAAPNNALRGPQAIAHSYRPCSAPTAYALLLQSTRCSAAHLQQQALDVHNRGILKVQQPECVTHEEARLDIDRSLSRLGTDLHDGCVISFSNWSSIDIFLLLPRLFSNQFKQW